MAFVWRTIGLGALVAAAPAVTQAQTLPQGSYQAGVLGRVELVTSEKDRLAALAVDGGPCHFEPKLRVLEGELQGRVVVGTLTVCLEGASCPATEKLPILAFYSAEDRSFTAYVRPPTGCKAPVVGEGSMVVLQPAAPVVPELVAPPAPRPLKRTPEAAREALKRGNELMTLKDWKGAIDSFDLSLYHNDRNWVTHLSLGTALLKADQSAKAIDALQRARALNTRNPEIYYLMACAYGQLADKKQALRNLESAVGFGLMLQGDAQDRKLDDLLASDGEFAAKYHRLIRQAFDNYDKSPAGKRQATGP